jgi:hypothetical protein
MYIWEDCSNAHIEFEQVWYLLLLYLHLFIVYVAAGNTAEKKKA